MTGTRARTINDLARLAGVSAGTVSRALAGSQLIAPATRDRIQLLAREHEFRPNVTARNLRNRRTGAIGVLIPLGHEAARHLSDPFFMAMLGHLADGLAERGHDLLLSRVIPANRDWLIDVVDAGRVDGVILIGQSDQADAIEAVARRYLPLVAWGALGEGQVHCSVGTDNRMGGALAARHLVDRGARRFAFLGDPVSLEVAQRLEGARTALAGAGLGAALDVLPAHLSADTAPGEIGQWLAGLDQVPDGIIAASDVIALAAIRALAGRGLSVPADVRVTGFDDLSLAAQAQPPLTTVRQDVATGAGHLIDCLFRRLNGDATASVVMTPELVVRQSA